MTDVFFYGRVSTVKQAERDLSIPDQIAQMKAHAEAMGWTHTGTYIDAGVSGMTDQRPQFLAMIDDAIEGTKPVDVILVHSFSRLFRESFLFEQYRRQLLEKNIVVASLTENFGEGETAIVMQQLTAIMTEWQSRENAKHVRRTRLESARRGSYNGGIPRYGYRTVAVGMSGDRMRKRLEPDPDEAEIVRLIYRLRNEGDGETGPIGTIAIANWLNSRGYTVRRGKRFYTSLVHRVLTDELYIGRHWTNVHISKTGKIRPKEEWILTPCDPIISDELYQKTQVLLAESRPVVKAPRRITSNVLLGDLCHCAGCGSALMIRTGTSRTGRVYRYYHCSSRQIRGKVTCAAPASIREDFLDDAVLTALCEEVLTAERTAMIVEAVAKLRADVADTDGENLSRLKRNKTALARELDNLIDAVMKGALRPSIAVTSTQDRLENQLGKLAALIEVKEKAAKNAVVPLSPAEAEPRCAMFREKLRSAPLQVQKRYVRAFVFSIEVGQKGIRFRGSGGALADITTTGEVANDLAAAQVQSSVRKWRSGRDSNPRYGFAVYSLSRRAPSTTRPPLRMLWKLRALNVDEGLGKQQSPHPC